MNPEIFGIALLVGLLAISFRLFAGGMDKERIEAWFEERGVETLEVSWEPFGPGWFGNERSRIYRVVYVDEHGDEREAHCKTNLFAGVYMTGDRLLRSAEQRREVAP